MGKHLADEPQRSSFSLGRLLALALGVCFIVAAAGILVVAAITHKNPLVVVTESFVQPPQALFNKDRILVLLVGRDYDYNEKDEETSKIARSDVIQVYSLDFTNHAVNEISVPRDMDVILPNGREAKINQALSDGGIPEAEVVIAKFLGVPPFDRWVALRINSTKQIIDAVGGIDVPVKEQMDYDDTWGHLHIHFKPGMHHMNGEQAVGYARFRHDACGDPCRITRQQQVMHILVAKLKNNKLNDLAHITALTSTFKNNVDTNLSTTEMVSLAVAFAGIDPKTMKTAQIPYVDTKDTLYAGNVLIPDQTAKQKMVSQLLLQTPAPPAPASSPDPATLAAIAPSTVKVDVKNGTGTPGTAHKVADALRAKGFVIGAVGNAATSDYLTSEIHEHTAVTFAGAKVRSLLSAKFKNIPIVSDATTAAAPSSDVTIIVGKDFLTASSQQASLK